SAHTLLLLASATKSASRTSAAGSPSLNPAMLRKKLLPFGEERCRQDHLVNLGGAVDQPRLPSIAVHPFKRRILGIAARTAKLDGRIDRLVKRLRNLDFVHGDFLASKLSLVQLPRRLSRQQTAHFNRHCRLAKQPLHAFMPGQRHAETLPRANIDRSDLQRPLRHAEPAHAVREPRLTQP